MTKTNGGGPRSASAGKAVTTKKEGAVVDPTVYDYGTDAGLGTETLTREDYSVPFLYLLQALSPIVTEGRDERAKPGMIMDTLTQELYPADESKNAEGVTFIPCYKEHLFGEWRPRTAGGGFITDHKPDSAFVRELKASQPFGKLKTADGNDLIETFYVYGLYVKPDGMFEPSVIAFTSTKIKVYKQWMTRIGTMKVPTPGGGKISPPMWAHEWNLKSVLQRKNENSWFNFKISFAKGNAEQSRLAPNDELYQEAKALYESCKEGGVRVATESLAAAAGGAGGEPGDDGEPAPF